MGNSIPFWLRRLVADPSLERARSDSRQANVTGSIRENPGATPELQQLRAQLKAMPKVHPPARLLLDLKILASKEHARAIRFRDWPATLRYVRSRASLQLENLMRPLALPAFGGVFAALVLFLMLAPVYPMRSVNAASFDVPTRLSTSASVKTMASFTAVEKPVMVLVFVNNEGRVVGYRIEGGHDSDENMVTRRRIEQILLFTVFTPATSFGMPTSDQVRISVGSNVVLVRG